MSWDGLANSFVCAPKNGINPKAVPLMNEHHQIMAGHVCLCFDLTRRRLALRIELLRWARRDAEGPGLDPVLDSTRILVLAQRLAAEEVNGPRPPDASQGEQASAED